MGWSHIRSHRGNDLKLALYESAELINKEHWRQVNSGKNIYLTLEYLTALEDAVKNEIEFRYILFYSQQNKPVAIAVVQMLRFVDHKQKHNEHLCKIAGSIKNKILNKLDIKVMICGNVFSCGENGFMFTDDIDGERAYGNLSNALYRLRQNEKINGTVSMVLLKEFWPKNYVFSDVLKTFSFRDFMIDVNMILKTKNWLTFDDYLASMTSKFRTKAKSAFKKSSALVVKSLSENEIKTHQTTIETLYNSVLEKADFQFGHLNGRAFFNFKRNLGNRFILNGYFLDEKLVGFSSAFITEKMIDASYVGMEYTLNTRLAIYQRMLYDLVKLAIDYRCDELSLGRTAEEIKSSLGAKPVNMKLYMRHRNSVSNKLIKPIIESITPSEFELRNPFKAQLA